MLVPSEAGPLNLAIKRSSMEKDTTRRNFLSSPAKTSVEKPNGDARDETSVQSAVQLGRALGQARVAARQLGESIAEGKLQAEIEQDALRTEESLKQAELLSGNLEEWDARFRLRRMKRSDLLELARARGLKKYSKLNKVELREMLETTLFEE